MGTNDENNLYYRGKRPIINEYEDNRESVLSGIASQSFCRMPGFAKRILTRLELGAKEKLSSLNFEILQSAIERELKQSGLSYDLAYRQALVAWELSRQGLISALDRELADAKRSQQFTEEALNQLEIEVDLRALVLEAAKLAFARTEETYRQRDVAADSSVNSAETLLINEKILTAQKRLALVDTLEEIIAAERVLLDAERANVDLETDLVEAKGELVAKEAEKIQPMMNLAAEKVLLAQAIRDRIAHEAEILQLALAMVFLQRDKIDADLDVMEAETALNDLRLTLNEARTSLSVLKSNNQISLDSIGSFNKVLEMTEVEATQDVTLNAGASAMDKILSINVSENKVENETIQESSSRMTAERKRQIILETADSVRDIEKSAEISAAANITSKLTHILSE